MEFDATSTKFDVVLGIDSASFSAGIAELYNAPDKKAYDAFFQGEYQGQGVEGTWAVVGDAPDFRFEAPTLEKWRDSVDKNGQHPPDGDLPADNVFVLSIPSLQMAVTKLPTVSPEVEFYGQVTLTTDSESNTPTVSLTPLAVWADESQLGQAKPFVNGIILPQVFKKLATVLEGHEIPSQQFPFGQTTLELTIVGVLITDTHLIVVATDGDTTAVAVPSAWPTDPVFAIVNRGYALNLAQQAAAANKNKTLYDKQPDGTNKTASLAAKAVLASVDDITVSSTDATSWSGELNVSFDVSATVLGSTCALKKAGNNIQ
ncbi:hypothetical protein K7711_18885 [Nocardia sp. CA2R105]|uniref:hypothetical protein n=1 Tax=Nocardia coffeae TaxID=2873381 RepID=UPI001CA738F3|nr:hypothetical protein [Nocardia coffeae]MBY8858552.1 hypothetical protein [Nocardia coffeae]